MIPNPQETAYCHQAVTIRPWRAAGPTVSVIGLVVVLMAGCSSGGGAPASHPSTGRSSSATASTPAMTTTVTWPTTIGSYELESLSGQPARAPERDLAFLQTVTGGKSAQIAAYSPKGGSFMKDGITVEAGQLQPGAKPSSAIQAVESTSAQNAHVPANLDTVAVPPGPLGGQIACWDQPAFGNQSATAWCMWADTSTYGVLGATPLPGTDPTSSLAKTVLTIRTGMEH